MTSDGGTDPTKTGFHRHAYVKFDLASISEPVTSAMLKMTFRKISLSGDLTIPACGFYHIDNDSWKETEITWNNSPYVTNPGCAQKLFSCELFEVKASAADTTIEVDLTQYIKAEEDGYFTLMFAMVDPETYGTEINLYQKECPDHDCLVLVVNEGTTLVENENLNTPVDFSISQNYPNPFNPETSISYSLARTGNVDMTIVDVMGREIRSLLHEVRSAGDFKVTWDGLDDAGNQVASGVYFTKISANGQSKMIKMLLVR